MGYGLGAGLQAFSGNFRQAYGLGEEGKRRKQTEAREDELYERQKSRYGMQDELDQLQLGKARREDEFGRQTFDERVEHAGLQNRNAKQTNKLNKFKIDQAQDDWNRLQASKAIRDKIDVKQNEATLAKLNDDILGRKINAFHSSPEEFARLMNADSSNGIENAATGEVIKHPETGEEIYVALDKDGAVVKTDDGKIWYKNKKEMDARYRKNTKGKWGKLNDGQLFNDATAETKDVAGAGGGAAFNADQRGMLRAGVKAVAEEFNGSFNPATDKWSIPDTQKVDYSLARAIYEKAQVQNWNIPPGVLVERILVQMRTLPSLKESRKQIEAGRSWYDIGEAPISEAAALAVDDARNALRDEHNLTGPPAGYTRQPGSEQPDDAGSEPVSNSADNGLSGTLPRSTVDAMPTGQPIVIKKGPRKGEKWVKDPDGLIRRIS